MVVLAPCVVGLATGEDEGKIFALLEIAGHVITAREEIVPQGSDQLVVIVEGDEETVLAPPSLYRYGVGARFRGFP